MRVSTSQFYKVNGEQMSAAQSKVAELQTKLGSGKQMVKPSEDPGKAILDYMSRQETLRKNGIKQFVDDRFPDFRSYAEWSWKKLNDRHARSVTMPDMAKAYETSSP